MCVSRVTWCHLSLTVGLSQGDWKATDLESPRQKGVAQEGVLEVVEEQRGGGWRRGRAALGVDLEARHLGGSPDHTKMTSLPWRTLPLGTGCGSASGSRSQGSWVPAGLRLHSYLATFTTTLVIPEP